MRVNADELNGNWPMFGNAKKGRWSLLRPENYAYESWGERVRNAWDVLTGKADALYWESKNDN